MEERKFVPVKDKLTKAQKKGLEKPIKPKRRKVNPWITRGKK
jgi:hypothetical protein